MFGSVELGLLLAAAGGAVSGNLLGWAARRIDKLVRRTPTKLDDTVWFTVRDAMEAALSDFEGKMTEKQEEWDGEGV